MKAIVTLSLATSLFAFNPAQAQASTPSAKKAVQNLREHPKVKKFLEGVASTLFALSCDIRSLENEDLLEPLECLEGDLHDLHWILLRKITEINEAREEALGAVKQIKEFIEVGALESFATEREALANNLEQLALLLFNEESSE